MPLTYAGQTGVGQPITERHERARKVKGQYTEGELVRVAGARHQAEAEFIQGLLLEEGVPSMLRRTRGFDVPDMMAAGPRDVMVPASGAEAAREILLDAEIVEAAAADVAQPNAYGVLLALLAAVLVVTVLVFILA